jgi:hypothetical protein
MKQVAIRAVFAAEIVMAATQLNRPSGVYAAAIVNARSTSNHTNVAT